MKDFAIADALRYVFSGVIIFAYLYLVQPAVALKFSTAAGTLGFPLVVAVIGSLTYFIYRPLVYDPLITRLQSRFERKRTNYAQFLSKHYAIDAQEARVLWNAIKNTHLADMYGDMKVRAAGIHMTYLAGILALPFAIWALALGEFLKGAVLCLAGAIGLLAGFLNDAAYEEAECAMLFGLDPKARDATAHALGYLRSRPAGDV